MTAAPSLSEIVYNHLFPSGSIPIKLLGSIPEIDTMLREIKDLAAGKAPAIHHRRISDADASQRLTDQIVELRESCDPPMTYQEIVNRLGNLITKDAARDRYSKATMAARKAAMQKEGYAAISGESIQNGTYQTPPDVLERIDSTDHIPDATKLMQPETASSDQLVEPDKLIQEAKPPHVEDPTDRNFRIVQESGGVKPDDAKKVSDLTPSEIGKINGPRISHDWDEFLLAEKESGKSLKDILAELRSKGIDCSLADVTNRVYVVKNKREAAKKVAPAQPEATTPQSPPGVEGAQEAARSNPRGSPEEKPPAPKSITRADLNIRIYDAWQKGDSIERISAELNADGYYYDETAGSANRLKSGSMSTVLPSPKRCESETSSRLEDKNQPEEDCDRRSGPGNTHGDQFPHR